MIISHLIQISAAVWLGIDSKLAADWGVAVGSILAALAAVYAAFVGLRTYKDSVMTSRARTLLEAEAAFTKVMPTLMLIEDPDRYNEKIAPLINKVFSDPHQRIDDTEFKLLYELDNAIRFFYIFVRYEQFNIKHQGVLRPYHYYWRKMTDDNHSEFRDYIKRYYETLWDHFQSSTT